MSSVIKDVKLIEDDLVSKEKQLEKKFDEKKHQDGENGHWGADKIDMHPLMPHFGSPKNFKNQLHEIGERIQDKVMNLRKEIFGDDEETKQDEMPQFHIFRMGGPPPIFPDFFKFHGE